MSIAKTFRKNDTIEALRELSTNRDYEDYKIYKNALHHYLDNHGDYRELKRFNDKLNKPINEIIRHFIGRLFPDLPLEIENKIMFVYTRYYFVYNNVKELFESKNDSKSDEKTEWLIQQYLNTILYRSNFSLYLNDEKENSSNRIHNEPEQWIKFFESLHELYHGKAEKFIKSYNSLKESRV